jgi:hypothetical protein
MKNGISQVFPLTEMQKGMLFHSIMEPNSGIYCEQFIFEILGELNIERLQAAWQRVVNDNDILRISTIAKMVREPVQVVHETVQARFTELNLTDLATGEFEAQLTAYLDVDRRNGFDFDRPHLIRATAIRAAPGRLLFMLTYHHLILDAWSLFLLMKELVEQYDTGAAIDKVAPYYADYVRSLRGHSRDASNEFWREYLSGYRAVTKITRPASLEPVVRNAAAMHREIIYHLDDGLTASLLAVARSKGLTLNSLIQSAWGLVIAEASGERDVVFGITITHRPHDIRDIDRMVGIFINSLPKRVRIDPSMTVHEYIASVQQDQFIIKQHESVALPDIQKLSEIGGGKPIFETLLIFENFLKHPSWKQAENFTVQYFRYLGWTNYPLAIEAMPPDGKNPMYFQVKYDMNYFADGDVRPLLDSLRNHLQALTKEPGKALKDILRPRQRTAYEPGHPAEPPRFSSGQTVVDATFEKLSTIWRSVLNRDVVDSDRTFFELGGHSLLLFQLQTRIFETFGVEIDIVDLFETPTLSGQAAMLRALTTQGVPVGPTWPAKRADERGLRRATPDSEDRKKSHA